MSPGSGSTGETGEARFSGVKTICVFCGSANGRREGYARSARKFGAALAAKGLGLVYGGGSIGLMGVVADAALEGGAPVVGVIPRALFRREIAHHGLTRLEVVPSMHVRKARMARLSDAFVALPGGIGTLEELFEAWTWGQLGLHAKPCGLLNVAGYFDGLIAFLDHAVDERFVREATRSMLIVGDDPSELLDRFAGYRAPTVEKWIRKGES